MTKLESLLVESVVGRGLSEVAAIAKTVETFVKIRRGLFECKRAKHYRWIEFQRGLHRPIDVMALIRQHYGLREDAELNVVQWRVAELLAGSRVKARKDRIEEQAVEAKEWIEINLLPKLRRGRPDGAGKAQSVKLRPPGATKAVTFLDVSPTIAEVIETVIPAVQEHVDGRIDLTRGRARQALIEAVLSLIADPNDAIRTKKQKNSISREVTAYFSKNLMT